MAFGPVNVVPPINADGFRSKRNADDYDGSYGRSV